MHPFAGDRAPDSPFPWGWTALGIVGAAFVAYGAPGAVHDSVVGWWYTPSVPSSAASARDLVYLGMAIVCIAWIGLGRRLPGTRALIGIGLVWIVPLLLAPPLFSRDIYSYLAQGTILHLGHNPYDTAPAALAGLGQPHVVDAVSSFWRHTTAPYGPLFLGAIAGIVSVTGSHLIGGALLVRGLELIGWALLAVFVPRIARSLGADPRRALWLVLLSPLMTIELIAAGHNDVLMAGMLAAGAAIALGGRPLIGVAICALAATIKVPALAAVVLITIAWARDGGGRAAAVRFVLACGLVTAAVLAAVTALTGVGASWLSTSLFSTPAKVHLAITPATDVGWTAAWLLRAIGVPASAHTFDSVAGLIAFALAAAAGVVIALRTRVPTFALSLGLLLVIAAAGGPAAWPWYFIWGLTLLAACPGPQRSRVLVVAVVFSAFVVAPDGILVLPVQASPVMLIVYCALVAMAVFHWRRRRALEPLGSERRQARAESSPSPVIPGTV